MMAILFGLVAALSWGVADFCAARVSRQVGTLRALALTQSVSFVVLLVVVAATNDQPTMTPKLLLLTLGLGLLYFVGTQLLYHAFETGTLSLVSPISSSFVIVTALLDSLDGKRPGPMTLAAALLLFCGVALATRSAPDASSQEAPAPRTGINEAIIAALCFGFVFYGLDGVIQNWACSGRSSDCAL